MKAEIISTGDEVITGMIDDTNTSWLSQQLLSLGIQVTRRSTVGDDLNDLIDVLSERSKYCDLIIFNGGLGPTTDDNTTTAVCKVLNTSPVLLDFWLERIKEWHRAKGRAMPESNKKQAFIPNGATYIDNTCGTACGYRVKINKAISFFTPGVPSELKVMFEKEILPYIKDHLLDGSKTMVKRLFTFGISESLLQDKIAKYNFDKSIVIGYRAYYPTIELKIIAHNSSKELFSKAISTIKSIIKDYEYLEESDDISNAIKELDPLKRFCIFDNATEGLLGTNMSTALNVDTVIATADKYKEIYKELLNSRDHDCTIILDRDDENDGVYFYIFDKKQNINKRFYVKLNISIKSRKKHAYALFCEILTYQLLKEGKISLHPDNATLENRDI